MLTSHEIPTPFNPVRSLLDRLTPTAPDARERLAGGIDVVYLGCGRGSVLMTLAAAFPRSRFTGYDRSAEAIADAAWLARTRRLQNIAFHVLDAQAPPDTSRFQLVMADGPVTWQ
jgi:tRNA G46 methylase TrmB